MTSTVTIRQLFEQQHERLNLQWVTGSEGSGNEVLPEELKSSNQNISLIGHLNLIHPHRIQVLGTPEIHYLENLDAIICTETLRQLFARNPAAVIISDGNAPLKELENLASSTATPLLMSTFRSPVLVKNIDYYLSNLLADSVTVHGAYLEVMGIGVMLTGKSGVGKSELALELISRGHRLIADDIAEFTRISPDTLNGTCPDALQDFLEVRGLGILDIRSMFGDNAIKHNKFLRLFINLEQMSDEQIRKLNRLEANEKPRTILGIDIPEITLAVAPGRNLAVLVESAARNHVLIIRGYDATKEFVKKQKELIDKSQP